MSKNVSAVARLQNDSHGTTASYIIGFVLSLVYTIIPYLLVTNNVASGTTLMIIILSFAFVQMLIQVFFFLHLGRGPKPFYNVGFFVCTVIALLVVTFGSLFIMNNLYSNTAPIDVITTDLAESEAIYQVGGELTGACQSTKKNHQITISKGSAYPLYTEANQCDTLTFINEDSSEVIIAFGPHLQHESYGGVTEMNLNKGKNETITLNRVGTFNFHDDMNLEITGSFTVLESK